MFLERATGTTIFLIVTVLRLIWKNNKFLTQSCFDIHLPALNQQIYLIRLPCGCVFECEKTHSIIFVPTAEAAEDTSNSAVLQRFRL